jgi:hypothetical protein
MVFGADGVLESPSNANACSIIQRILNIGYKELNIIQTQMVL